MSFPNGHRLIQACRKTSSRSQTHHGRTCAPTNVGAACFVVLIGQKTMAKQTAHEDLGTENI